VPTWNLVDSRVVGHQVAALAAQATVLTFDPRGSGASDRPAHGYGFPMHAADAIAVLAANGVDRASLVTASRGMNTAVLLASDHPGRFERIVAVAPFVVVDPESEPDDDSWIVEWRTDWAGFVVPFMQAVFTEPDSDDVLAEVTAIALEADAELMITQELELDWRTPSKVLGSVSCPTLLIHGDMDEVTSPSASRRLAEAMPDARIELIPGGGHRPDIRSSDLVNPLMEAFLLE
jgi:pimeloyl-ACP methyl ester carboxylesterase